MQISGTPYSYSPQHICNGITSRQSGKFVMQFKSRSYVTESSLVFPSFLKCRFKNMQSQNLIDGTYFICLFRYQFKTNYFSISNLCFCHIKILYCESLKTIPNQLYKIL